MRKFSILWETERKLIVETLEFFSYNHTKTAECLGISDRTVRSKLSQYRALGYFIPNNPLYEKKSRKKENKQMSAPFFITVHTAGGDVVINVSHITKVLDGEVWVAGEAAAIAVTDDFVDILKMLEGFGPVYE